MVEQHAYPQRCEVGQGIPHPKAQVFHVQHDAEQYGHPQPQHDPVHDCRDKIYPGIAAAVDQRVAAAPARTAEKRKDRNGTYNINGDIYEIPNSSKRLVKLED